MTKEKQINILMQDHCTKKEAENFISKNRAVIYEDPAEYLQMLKYNNCYEGETIEDIRRGLPDVSLVKYEDHEYLIMYIN